MSEEKNNLRIHARITPDAGVPTQPQTIRWKCLPHPKQKNTRHSRQPLSFSDRLLRNSALACALLLAVLAMGNINQPWAQRTSQTIQRALTMHIDLDESIGQLSFVQKLMPESALVFFNIGAEAELFTPVQGELTHPYDDAQPWLMFTCPDDSIVHAVDAGTVTAISELSDGSIGVLIDHGSGRESVCAYMASISVQTGDVVARGQSIGLSGSMLYFEWRENEIPANPSEKMGL